MFVLLSKTGFQKTIAATALWPSTLQELFIHGCTHVWRWKSAVKEVYTTEVVLHYSLRVYCRLQIWKLQCSAARTLLSKKIFAYTRMKLGTPWSSWALIFPLLFQEQEKNILIFRVRNMYRDPLYSGTRPYSLNMFQIYTVTKEINCSGDSEIPHEIGNFLASDNINSFLSIKWLSKNVFNRNFALENSCASLKLVLATK